MPVELKRKEVKSISGPTPEMGERNLDSSGARGQRFAEEPQSFDRDWTLRHCIRASLKRERTKREGGDQARPREPVAVAGVERRFPDVGIVHGSGGFLVGRQGFGDVAGGVDHGGDAVVGGAENPAAIFGGAHADQQQVLLARGAVAEVAVIREVHQKLGAVAGELAD